MNAPVSMPLSKWPKQDRDLWLEAADTTDMFDFSKISMWHAATKKVAVGAYGIWLQWLAEHSLLTDGDPAARLSPTAFRSFAKAQIAKGLSMTTVADRLGRLVAIISGLCPGSDLTHARRIVSRVKAISKMQTRPKGFIVHARRMYELGFDLMAAGRATGVQTDSGANLFVDGLVVALLTACPMRIGNFSRLRLDHEVAHINNGWRLLVSGGSTKTSKPEIRLVPDNLSSSVDEYVAVVRPRLVLERQHSVVDQGAFFIGPSGLPLRDQMMRRRIETRTEAAFGAPVLPHSFRKLAVTTLVLERPEHAASAPMLLEHDGARTCEDHYIIGQQILALKHYHKALKSAEKQTERSDTVAKGAL